MNTTILQVLAGVGIVTILTLLVLLLDCERERWNGWKLKRQRVHDDLNKHADSIRELNKDVTLLLTDVRDIWGKIDDLTPAENKTQTAREEPTTVAEVLVAVEECRDTDKVDQFCLDEDGDLFKWCAGEARSYIVYEGVSGPFWDVFGTSYDEYLRYRHTPITRQQAERLTS